MTESHRHRATTSLHAFTTPLRRLVRRRARVEPRLQRRYRTTLAGGLALALVAGVSATAVVEDDAAGARADLAALGLEADAESLAPGVSVPASEELEMEEFDVDVELGKSDVWHLRDAEVASRNAERAAIAEREAIAERRAAESTAAQEPRSEVSSNDEVQEEPAEEEPVAATSAGQGGERGSIASMVNSFRSQNGVHTLGRDGTLDQVAQGWAEWMAANQTLQHNPNYRSQIGSGWSSSGENIVRNTGGASMSPGAITSWMVDWWKNSSVHRANMLNGKYTHVGVGYSMGSGGPYAVLLFGGR